MSDPDIFGGGGGNPSSYILCLLTKSKPLKIFSEPSLRIYLFLLLFLPSLEFDGKLNLSSKNTALLT